MTKPSSIGTPLSPSFESSTISISILKGDFSLNSRLSHCGFHSLARQFDPHLPVERWKGSSLAGGLPPPNTRREEGRITAQGQSSLHNSPPKPAARSRLIIGDFGPSDSALAASSGWRLRRPAADRHAARCASRDLCSGGAPRRYPPSAVKVQEVGREARSLAASPLRTPDERRVV